MGQGKKMGSQYPEPHLVKVNIASQIRWEVAYSMARVHHRWLLKYS